MTKLLREKFPKIVNTKFTASMESSLDKVGEGQEDYIKMLHAFYDDFDVTLQKVKEEMKTSKSSSPKMKRISPVKSAGV